MKLNCFSPNAIRRGHKYLLQLQFAELRIYAEMSEVFSSGLIAAFMSYMGFMICEQKY